jgi:hypothetical protein
MSNSDLLVAISIFTNVVLTIIIICLNYRGSKINEQSAKAAEESAESAKLTYELSKQMSERQISKEQRSWEALRRRYLRIARDNATACHYGLLKAYSFRLDGKINSIEEMRDAPREHGLTNEQLAEYFSESEIKIIEWAWLVFNDFIKKYYKESYTEVEERIAISNAGGAIDAFRTVMETLDNEIKN